jgi:hypothetical protein
MIKCGVDGTDEAHGASVLRYLRYARATPRHRRVGRRRVAALVSRFWCLQTRLNGDSE